MTSKRKAPFVEEAVKLLVQHFGAQRVSAALAKASRELVVSPDAPALGVVMRPSNATFPNIQIALEQLRLKNQEKHSLLEKFYVQLRAKTVLPESQDIRQFAQIVGLKDIRGKARKDLVPQLMRFLLEQPVDRLQGDLKQAATISEQQRQQGFSVLTDKLLRAR
jgi:hypothetical protein